ncbi:glutamate receptor ionotropic, kainate glr-3-like [Hyalella azteca]|uniref:Glutamate receptor ionotropic, kainate glr-3-like n=1 Tax=Hyalella azteca TaxID=294128 RepID=A0A979FLF1_HYAAZ|nr:glutamate receptor ionotropic, kainate glr-3-like [Hyalella azteca]
MTVVMVFCNDPSQFLNQLASSLVWNPELIVLFSLRADLDHNAVANHNVVQRSQYITLIRPSASKKSFLLYNVRHSIFDPPGANKTVLLLVGMWDSQAYKHKFKQPKRRIDSFRKVNIDLASICYDFPFMYDGPNNTCPGAAFDMLDILAAKLDFTYTWQDQSTDGRWGSKENGTWTGMFADLLYHNKSIIINNIELTLDRQEAFDMTYPYFSEGFSIMLKIPDPLPRWRGLLYPFTRQVWVYIVSMAVVAVLLFTFVMSFMQNFKPHHKGFLQMLASLSNQGYSNEVHGWWMHVWMLTWWFMCYVLCLAYTCNLVAFLTITVPRKRIETIDELADSNVIVAMENYGNYVPEALRESSDPSLAKIGARFDLYEASEWDSVIKGKVTKGTYAVINGQSFHYFYRNYFNLTTQCYFMREVLYPSFVVYYLRKNTPHTELLSENLQRLVEAGLVGKLYNKHMMKDAPPDQDDGLQALTMPHLAAAFILCLCLYAVATLCLLLELLTARRVRQGKNTFKMETLFVG